jgi:hypothetical protein
VRKTASEESSMTAILRIRATSALLLLGTAAVALAPTASAAPGPRFEISFGPELCPDTLDGRLLLLLSTDDSLEPRFQIKDGPDTQLAFGVDVEGLAPGDSAAIGPDVLGYPIDSLADLPPGEYVVQALLHRYETFHRADGHTVKLPMDRGEGQQWNKAPGNLYSTPRQVAIDPSEGAVVEIELDTAIPPIEPPAETKYVKHERIQSELLTEFWGRPMYLGAHVLLPEGFEDHPEARYPLIINHDHFTHDFGGFREEPPDPDLEPKYSERFDWPAYNRTEQEHAYQFYRKWTGPDFPRMIIVEIQHPNPYYDDSYAVNSANLGPYGDAIVRELIPHIERKYRGIGEGWARFVYGGSTGGWEALAVQVLYPDEFGGCFAACPDPIDFRAYTVVNIYEDQNAYYLDSQWKRTPRPGHRDHLGHVSATLEEMNRRELVLGTRGRSGQQWDIWQAVYSPVGADGYPKPIWDKRTGEIDHEVAAHWRESYDLSHILRRDWATLGPKLEGKIHIYVGDMDNYYLNNAVYLVEEFLESTEDPHYGGEIDYGDRAEHCWNGDHTRPNATSRLRYNQMYVPKIMERIQKTAPPGADLTSWRY